MNLLNIIDQLTWKEYLIFISVFFAIVNFVAWVVLVKRQKIASKLKEIAKKIAENTGFIFIDGGVLVALFGVGIVALITTKETVSKNAVVTKQEIKVDDKIYKCQPIRQRVIKYYDLDEKKTKPLPLPPKKECK